MKDFRDIGRKMLHGAKAFLFSWDAVTFLCFVMVAAVMWYGHALSTTRQMTIHVPVTYKGVPKDLSFKPELPKQIDVTLRDNGRRLIAQSEDLPTITFDLSDQIKGSEGKVHIEHAQIISQLPSSMQGNGTTQVVSVRPDNIEARYSEQFTERRYTFTIEAHKVPAGYNLRLFPAQVEVIARVSQSHYNDISAKDITVYCECPSSGNEDKLPVHFIHRSKYIKSVRIEPAEVEYIIERTDR
ncbi:MAG: hypothetical protein IKN59_05865 [Paludibacteraceae bacterium]|nr:hypothetical protein [Paludibacteraceae bacterium]